MSKKNQKEETIVDVQEVYSKTEVFVDRHRTGLTFAIVAIALVFVGYFAYQNLVVNPNNQEGAEAIWKAEHYFEMDSLDLALQGDGMYLGFEDIAAEYGQTPAGKRANYYMGIIYRNRGEYEAALDYFKKADFNDEIVGVMAMGNVGDMYVEVGNLEEALVWFKKAVSKAESSASAKYSAPTYLMKLGIVQLALEDKSGAKASFSTITKKYPEYNEVEKARKYEYSVAK